MSKFRRSHVNKESVYNGLWKCRDLEIQMLWTRLTLLGAIMALTYTGYGVLLMKMLEQNPPHWNTFNLLAILMGSCGMAFSCLWIATAKGSKRWYEQYETALGCFQKVNQHSFERFDDGSLFLSYLDFDNPELVAQRQPEDSSLFTSVGGRFSVSKIPIVFGQLSLVGWCVLSFLHLAAIYLGKSTVKRIVDELGLQLGAFMILTGFFAVSIVCGRIKSSFK